MGKQGAGHTPSPHERLAGAGSIDGDALGADPAALATRDEPQGAPLFCGTRPGTGEKPGGGERGTPYDCRNNPFRRGRRADMDEIIARAASLSSLRAAAAAAASGLFAKCRRISPTAIAKASSRSS